MTDDNKNYMKLDYWNPFRSRFVYVDTEDYLADRCLRFNEVKVKFLKGEFHKEGSEYIVVICEIPSKHEDRFIASMEQLKTNMIHFGHDSYENVCADFFDMIKRGSPN